MKNAKKRRSNKYLVAFAIFVSIIIVLAGYLYLTRAKTTAPASTSQNNSQPTTVPVFTPYTATFQIIINGETRIFTDPRYHNKSADVYIPPEGSSQVQVVVTKPNITWGDLFTTLPMSVDTKCIVTGTKQTFCTNSAQQLRFYINGVESPNALTTVIEPNSQLKIVY